MALLLQKNVVPGPVAWESPQCLLKMQNLRSTLDLLNQNLQKHCPIGSKKKSVTHYTTKSTCNYWISVTQPGNFFFHHIYDIPNQYP